MFKAAKVGVVRSSVRIPLKPRKDDSMFYAVAEDSYITPLRIAFASWGLGVKLKVEGFRL